MSGVSRREFLKISGATAGAAIVGGCVSKPSEKAAAPAAQPAASTSVGSTILPYKPAAVTEISKLKVNTPVAFNFPDAASPCAIIKMGNRVPGGVGPDGDIVAYSTLCSHMGCPVTYDQTKRAFKCPCHFSMFDPEKNGQMICGQATQNLPQVTLTHNPKDGSIHALAINGLIYGRQANII